MKNLIDRIIEPFSPGAVVSRLAAREAIRAYEAARPSRTHKAKGEPHSADLAVQLAGKTLREQARYLDENHDLVTGLFNRSWFQEQLDRVSQQAVSSSQPSTLVYISIDAFSALQADIGIGGSDLVLADFAQILRQHFPEDALLARFGDDACSVLLEGCEPEAVTAQLPALLKRIESNLFEANGRTVRITASIGVSSISETKHEPTQAIERAHRLAEQVS